MTPAPGRDWRDMTPADFDTTAGPSTLPLVLAPSAVVADDGYGTADVLALLDGSSA